MITSSKNILQKFQDIFQQKPRLFYSPGRINLIGEHVDYNDGFVMPAAIDKGVYYAISANQTDVINFYAVDFNDHFSINIHEIKVNEDWKNYVLSVVNEIL